VTGDVVSSKRVPLSLKGDRVLDAIAAAGGPRFPAYETFVSLTRGKSTTAVLLAKLIAVPSENIYLRPDDAIFLFKQPQTFTAFGATASNAVVPFEAADLSLAEGVGRAGGLLDLRADPSGVFVFRYETAEIARQLGVNRPVPEGAMVPVVYRASLKDPQGYFATQRFMLRDKDVVYVSNAPMTDLQKFLTLLGSGVLVARNSTQTVTGN
jgi:polysaccharide export outer membrane protein